MKNASHVWWRGPVTWPFDFQSDMARGNTSEESARGAGGHNGNPGLGGGPSIIHDELSKRGWCHVLCPISGWSPSSWTAYTDKYCYFSNVRRVADSDFLAGTGIVRTAAYGKMLRKQQWLWLLPAALVLVC
jgi:hypothetical protein